MIKLFPLILVMYLHAVYGEAKQYYQISMVASGDHTNTPAIFHHGESPVWDAETQSLFFVDVHRQNVHKLDYVTGKIHTKHIGYGQVNVVSLVAGSKRLLVAVRSALYLMDWDVDGDKALRLLATVDEGLPDNVINEGKPDADGRFWAGTKGPQVGDDVEPDKAILFKISEETAYRPETQVKPITISNGLTWSANNTIFYYIDSPTQKIEAFDYNSHQGTISGRRTILDISEYGYKHAIPDGMTIDSKGHLWVSLMFGGTVLHIDPDSRQIIYAYKVPVSRVTSVCWGGPNLDELFVTTSKVKIRKEPLSGAIFTIRNTGSRGVPANHFKFSKADNY